MGMSLVGVIVVEGLECRVKLPPSNSSRIVT